MRDNHIGIGLLFHHLDLAQRRKGTREIPRDEDMTKTEATAIKEGRIVAHFRAKRGDHSGHRRSALSAIDVLIVNGVLFHQFIVMAGRVNAHADVGKIEHLPLSNHVARRVDVFGIMHNLLWNYQRLAQFSHYLTHLFAQFSVMHDLLTRLLVMAV